MTIPKIDTLNVTSFPSVKFGDNGLYPTVMVPRNGSSGELGAEFLFVEGRVSDTYAGISGSSPLDGKAGEALETHVGKNLYPRVSIPTTPHASWLSRLFSHQNHG